MAGRPGCCYGRAAAVAGLQLWQRGPAQLQSSLRVSPGSVRGPRAGRSGPQELGHEHNAGPRPPPAKCRVPCGADDARAPLSLLFPCCLGPQLY